ncbi:uncharacterized protein METZ01_LOCUS310408, partial [marine metagenome]
MGTTNAPTSHPALCRVPSVFISSPFPPCARTSPVMSDSVLSQAWFQCGN